MWVDENRDELAEEIDTSIEDPVFFDASGVTLFGILTRPTVSANGRVVVLLPGGGHSFIHRNRVAVRLARRLADLGFHTLRFDYHGVRDSDGTMDGFRLDRPFTDDLLGAVTWLRSQGFDRFIFIGACFGARTALASAPHVDGLEHLILMNTHVKDLKAGAEVDMTEGDTWSGREMLRRALSRRVLLNVASKDKRRIYASFARKRLTLAVRRLRMKVGGDTRGVLASNNFVEPLRRAAERGTDVLILLGEDDSSYRTFLEARRGELGRVLSEMQERIRVQVIDGSAGFQRVEGQTRVLELIERELLLETGPK